MKKFEFNDLFYVCSMIEYTARKTRNKRGTIVLKMGESGIRKQLADAPVNHCLSEEQVSDEWIQSFHIENGDFDTISACRYKVPDYLAIGKLYAYLIQDLSANQDMVTVLIDVFQSFLSDAISNFNTDLYYQNLSYLTACYQSGGILD